MKRTYSISEEGKLSFLVPKTEKIKLFIRFFTIHILVELDFFRNIIVSKFQKFWHFLFIGTLFRLKRFLIIFLY